MSQLQILVVDDDEVILSNYINMLKMLGYDCMTSDCGEDAVEMMQDVPFDILITDASMPGMHGFELLNHVAENSPDTRRILITGDAVSLGKAEELLQQGIAHRVLRKPCDVDTFEQAIKEQLNQIPIG